MHKGKLQELVVVLFLRLNGYFTSGLIVHHPDAGKVTTELDVLAVRFPWHAQPDRDVACAAELKCPEAEVDVIICEVKSVGQQLRFNSALADSAEALSKTLRWIGAFHPTEIPDVVEQVSSALARAGTPQDGPHVVHGPRDTCLRGILFSPERNSRRNNQPWFLPGPPVLEYVWQCLKPEVPRPLCSSQYDFGLWGRDLEPIVRFVKESKKPTTFAAFLTGFLEWEAKQGRTSKQPADSQ